MGGFILRMTWLIMTCASVAFAQLAASAVNTPTTNLTAVLSWNNGVVNSTAKVAPISGQSASRPQLPVLSLVQFGGSFDGNASQTLAYISCDSTAHGADHTSDYKNVLQSAVNLNFTGILMYSRQNSTCNISGAGSYDRIWTMLNSSDASELLDSDNSDYIATIGPTSYNLPYGTYSVLTGDNAGSSAGGLNMNTQVAMIVLYAVTGLVTILFLVIIVFGAVRAHRHPERYGPRNVLGRPRQTRARGIARAVLDSLPIVKFNDPNRPKDDDVEMAGNTAVTTEQKTPALSEVGMIKSPETSHLSPSVLSSPEIIQDGHESREHTIVSNPPDTRPTSMPISESALGCSICTDDFEPGQDVRVLPCDHKFHPACVDPWLLNVSGTCPLCRIDLRPSVTRDTMEGSTHDLQTVDSDGQALPPPLELDNHDEPDVRRNRHERRRSALLSLFGTLHHHNASQASDINREERTATVNDGDEILANLRRWRRHERNNNNTNNSTNNSTSNISDNSDGLISPSTGLDERTRRKRFSQLFGIGTRRTGANGVEGSSPL